MIIKLLERVERKLIHFFTFTLVIKRRLLEERDAWMIKRRIIQPLFFRILYPLGARINNYLIFFEYIFSKFFHTLFPFLMNNVTNIYFKYMITFTTEMIINPIIISFHFYLELFRVRKFFFILLRMTVWLFLHSAIIVVTYTKAINQWRKKRKNIAATEIYKRIREIKSQIFPHKRFIFLYSMEHQFHEFIGYIDDNTYEERLHVYIYATSPLRAIWDIVYEILTFVFIPLMLFKNIFFKIIYPPLKLRWLTFFFNAGYKKLVAFSREKYLFKFGYLLLFAAMSFVVANKLFTGGRYPFSKNKDTDILLGNWDPYSNWTQMFKKQLFLFFCALIFIYTVVAREYLVQWQTGAEVFMILAVVGLYLMERRYTKYLAQWEYLALSRYTFKSKKKKELFYSLLCSTRSFFMGIDNFIKYITLRITDNSGWRRYVKHTSKRRRHMLSHKNLPRKLKWVYGNEYVKKRHVEKILWRFLGGKEPNQYPYMDFPHFGVQMEDDYLSDTKISHKNKRRFHRITNHLSKRWKINYSKRSQFYLKEINPSINIISPGFKSEKRLLYTYTVNCGKIFKKMHIYPKRYNLNVFRLKPKLHEIFRLGKRKFLLEADTTTMGERIRIKFERRFELPWIYAKDIRNRPEYFRGKISKKCFYFRRKNKRGGWACRLIGEWWTMHDRKFHKLYKRTKYKKRAFADSWREEIERLFKNRKGKEESSFPTYYHEQNFVPLYSKILFTPSRKKTRLTVAGGGLYAWDMRMLFSRLFYWHVFFYYHYFPTWLQNLSPGFFRELLSYIFTISQLNPIAF